VHDILGGGGVWGRMAARGVRVGWRARGPRLGARSVNSESPGQCLYQKKIKALAWGRWGGGWRVGVRRSDVAGGGDGGVLELYLGASYFWFFYGISI